MRILVGIKHVPDTESKVKVAADGVRLDETAVNKWVISPYDEYALEEALQIRDRTEGQVTLVCAARDAAQPTVRQGLAMGADRAILVADERLERADGLTRARAIEAVARAEQSELILLGKYGVGSDEAQTGPMLAELLGWPHVCGVTHLEISDGGFSATREIEGAVEFQEGSLPAVVTCDKGLNEPRYPSLKGIMQAKKKPLELRTAEDLGLQPLLVNETPRVVWETLELPPERGAGRMLSGSPTEMAEQLARILREDEKVI